MNRAFATKWCDAGASRRSWGPAPTLPPHPSGWDETDARQSADQLYSPRSGLLSFPAGGHPTPAGWGRVDRVVQARPPPGVGQATVSRGRSTVHLKTLTVRGFKSFASATTFEFEPGVTAVVGPNGSGKSNVVDALAWVMGEQGAKSLRGGKMEDVIFAGTSARQALGRAHVTLTIDNADGALPIEYSEVTISRTLFRSGGSEYAINGSSCRLLDIQELLSDSGLGREMHVIVGQGQLDRILHATPEERRGFIEEAAGVLKHRRRKEKTLRKLASMEANVSRLEDLTGEIGRQLTPLGRQARVARRAQRIQHEVRDARARLFADDWVQASTALEADAEALAQAQEGLRRAEAVHEELTGRITELEAEAARLGPEVAASRDAYYALTQTTERFASLAQLADERVRAASAPVARAHLRDPEQLEAAVRRLEEELAGLTERQEQARADHERAGRTRAEAEAAAAEAQEHHAALVAQAAARREDIAALRGRMATARSEHEALVSRREDQRERIARLEERLAEQQGQLEQLTAAAGPSEEDHRAAAEASEQAEARTETTQRRLDEAAAEAAAARRELDAARARVAALTDAMPAADGTDAVLAAFPDRLVAVAEHLQTAPEHAAAVAAALGPLAEGLALSSSADREGIAPILETARQRDLGVVSVLTDDALGDAAEDGDIDGGEMPAPLARAAAAAGIPAHWAPRAVDGGDLAPRIRRLLARTALVADAAAAEALRRHLPAGAGPVWRIAAADGTVLEAHTARGGSADAVTGLEIRSRLDAARAAVVELQQTHERVRAGHDEASAEHRRAREQAKTARAEFARISRESTASAAALSRARTLVGTTEEELAAAREHLQELDAREPGLAATLKKAVGAVSAALELQRQEGTEAVDAAEAERTRTADAAAAARTAETEALLGVRAAESGLRAAERRLEAARRAVAAERTARAEVQRQEARQAARLRARRGVREMIARVAERIEVSLTEASRIREQTQTRRAAVETRLHEARTDEREQRDQLDELRRTTHSGELERATREARLESLREAVHEELSLTVETLVEDYGPHLPIPVLDEDGEAAGQEPFERAAQEKRLERARRDLKALGKVNPLALEEFAALEERHTYLAQQLEDLKRSRADLEEIIRDVDEHVRTVFAQAFADTQEQFVRVFGTLFPGGEGKLVLTDPQDLLTTGIEVHAKPAGKKVKRLSLLSGGERSLTAIAMLVAIFKARPSPFYVMDEVEAALDDRNLGRLLTILRELQESSQLIIITHQKRTMEIADALYGVSMRGDGITQVISQRLADLR